MRRSLFAVALIACGNSDDGSYASISVEPPFDTVSVPLGGTATKDYQVFGVGKSGERTEITATCTLAIDPDFGSFTAATATVGTHGGKATITAVCGTATGN